MSWFPKISNLLKTIFLMDQKITQLVEAIKRLDREHRTLSGRAAKLEAIASLWALSPAMGND